MRRAQPAFELQSARLMALDYAPSAGVLQSWQDRRRRPSAIDAPLAIGWRLRLDLRGAQSKSAWRCAKLAAAAGRGRIRLDPCSNRQAAVSATLPECASPCREEDPAASRRLLEALTARLPRMVRAARVQSALRRAGRNPGALDGADRRQRARPAAAQEAQRRQCGDLLAGSRSRSSSPGPRTGSGRRDRTPVEAGQAQVSLRDDPSS